MAKEKPSAPAAEAADASPAPAAQAEPQAAAQANATTAASEPQADLAAAAPVEVPDPPAAEERPPEHLPANEAPISASRAGRTLPEAAADLSAALGLSPAIARERLEHVAAAIARRYCLGLYAAMEALVGDTHREALVVLCAQSHDEMAIAAALAGCRMPRSVASAEE